MAALTQEEMEMLMNGETPIQNQEQKTDKKPSLEDIAEAVKNTADEIEKEVQQEAEQRDEEQKEEKSPKYRWSDFEQDEKEKNQDFHFDFDLDDESQSDEQSETRERDWDEEGWDEEDLEEDEQPKTKEKVGFLDRLRNWMGIHPKEEYEEEYDEDEEEYDEEYDEDETYENPNARETATESDLDYNGYEDEEINQEGRDSQEREEREEEEAEEEEEEVLFADTKEERKRAKEAEKQRKKEDRQLSRTESKNKFLSGLNWIKDKVGKLIVGLAGVFGKIAGTIAGWILLGGKSHASETFADELVKKWSAEENAKQNAEMEKNRKEQEKSGQNRDNQEQNRDKQPPTEEIKNPTPKPQDQNTQEPRQENENSELASEEEQQAEVINPEQNNENVEHNDTSEETVGENRGNEEQSSDEQNDEQHENPNQENGNEQNGNIGQQENQEMQDKNNNNKAEQHGKELEQNDKVETKIDKMTLSQLTNILQSEQSKDAFKQIMESFNTTVDEKTGKEIPTGVNLSIRQERDILMFECDKQGYGIPIKDFLKGDIRPLVNVCEELKLSMNQFSRSDSNAKYLLTAAFINGTIRKVNLEANNYPEKDVRNDETLVYCNFNDGKEFHFTIKRDESVGFEAQIGTGFKVKGELENPQVVFNDKHCEDLLETAEVAVMEYETNWNSLTIGIDKVTNCNQFIGKHCTPTSEQVATATVDQQVQQNNKENYITDEVALKAQLQEEEKIAEQEKMAKEVEEQSSEQNSKTQDPLTLTPNDFNGFMVETIDTIEQEETVEEVVAEGVSEEEVVDQEYAGEHYDELMEQYEVQEAEAEEEAKAYDDPYEDMYR